MELSPAQINARFAAIADIEDGPVSCQCDQHNTPCSREAVAVVEAHLLGKCDGPDANAFGNQVEVMCVECVRHLWAEARQVLMRHLLAAQKVGRIPACLSCGAPLLFPSDLVRSVKRMRGGSL